LGICRFVSFIAKLIFGDTMSPRLSHCTSSPCVIGERLSCRLCRDDRGDTSALRVIFVERFSLTIKAARTLSAIGFAGGVASRAASSAGMDACSLF
jgi:hypothetical protein